LSKATGSRTLQKFKKSWTTEQSLSCFEPYKKDEYSAWCKICLVKLSIAKGGKANLSKHISGASHIEACGNTNLANEAAIKSNLNAKSLDDKGSGA
jgi:hypothetical protein